MDIPFTKYHGAGNDFILIDQRQETYIEPTQEALIHKMCQRHFGIGADGLILLQNKEGFDFEMIYFNADGRTSSLCGNGGRCVVGFAHRLGMVETDCRFLAIDGGHEARIVNSNWIELKMGDIKAVQSLAQSQFFLDTGSPHFVEFVEDLSGLDIYEAGQTIRHSDAFAPTGTNVNFVQIIEDQSLVVATYERGVENETLSCGTGVTAAALSYGLQQPTATAIDIQTKGGKLQVRFQRTPQGFEDIWLCGPIQVVFEGTYRFFAS